MADLTYMPKVYKDVGGDEQVVASGGTLRVESGGVINVQTGGKLQNNGVDMDLSAGIATSTTATTNELNTLSGVMPGTASANKAVVLDAGKTIATITAATITTLTATDVNTANVTPTGNTKLSEAAPAAAGNSQGTGTAMTKGYNAVTGADGTKGVVLPTAAAGLLIVVTNTDAAQNLKVYPATGGQIDSAGGDTAITLAAGKTQLFLGASGTQWYSLLGA